MMVFQAEHGLNQFRWLDGEIRVFILGVMFRKHRDPLYEVCWVHNGTNQEVWVDGARLSDAKVAGGLPFKAR